VIADQNGRPADGETGLSPGYIFAPYIPEVPATTVDPNDFSLRKSIMSRHARRFEEPSAVDQLAAIADPEGEAARRVREWREWREWRSLINQRWRVYRDPLEGPAVDNPLGAKIAREGVHKKEERARA